MLGFVLLAATAAQAADRRECVSGIYEITGDMAQAKRVCDPKNQVTNPNEYGWVCYVDAGGLKREKGTGMKQKKDALCE